MAENEAHMMAALHKGMLPKGTPRTKAQKRKAKAAKKKK